VHPQTEQESILGHFLLVGGDIGHFFWAGRFRGWGGLFSSLKPSFEGDD